MGGLPKKHSKQMTFTTQKSFFIAKKQVGRNNQLLLRSKAMITQERVTEKKQAASSFVRFLRESIICSFEELEEEGSFERKSWNHPTGGGGEIGLLRG